MAEWLRGAQLLREQARVAWLLGEALEEALRVPSGTTCRPDAHELAQRWQRRIQEAVTGGTVPAAPTSETATAHGSPPARSEAALLRNKSRPSSSSRTVPTWEQITRRRLDEYGLPVVFIGNQSVRGQQLVLAVGIDLQGHKHVLDCRESGYGETLPSALAARGLDAAQGMLVVSDGSRTLDEAIQSTWRGRVFIQHCQYRLRQEVCAHLPQPEAQRVAQELDDVVGRDLVSARAICAFRRHRSPGPVEADRSFRPSRSLEHVIRALLSQPSNTLSPGGFTYTCIRLEPCIPLKILI